MQKFLIILGVVILAVGLLWPWLGKLGLGRLPGDIYYEGENVRIYLPIVTCLIISAIVTLLFRFFR